ncbi:transporter associated domain-containing protein [Haladaptatus pallidirubidus]
MSLPDLRSVAATGIYTRYLVLDEEDQSLGFVHAKDILRASETETDSDDPITARDLARAVLTVPETRQIDAILADFQTRGEGQMAVVVDEWGVFEGIVTIEDILEEIVGDIQDEFDTAAQEPSIEKRDDGAYVVDGRVPIQDVNDRLDTWFESDDVETMGGLVFSRLGRVPSMGDQIDANGYVLQVEAV